MSLSSTLSPSSQTKKKNALMSNHLSSVAVSLVLNTGLMILLLVFIKFAEPKPKDEFAVLMMEMDEVPPEEIEVVEEIIEEDVVEDVEVTDMVMIDNMTPEVDSSFPEETTLASDVASPVSLVGLISKMGGVSLGAVDGGLTRQTQFMGQSAEGTRFAFVIDYSKSMRPNQLKVMKYELYSALEKIGQDGLAAVIFFSGPVWRPDQDANAIHGNWKSRGMTVGWQLKEGAEGPESKWLLPTKGNLAALQRMIYQTPTTGGTDWYPPLKEALDMKPRPDIIFFMTDGKTSEESVNKTIEMVQELPKNSVQINTVALGITEKDAAPLIELAKMTGGKYRSYTNQEIKDEANRLPPDPTDFKDIELKYLGIAEVRTHMSRGQQRLPPVVEQDVVEFEL